MAKFIQDRVARVPSQNIRCTGGSATITLTGPHALGTDAAQFQILDGGGSDRDVHLPDVTTSAGAWFRIANDGGTNNLVVKSGGVTVISLPPDAPAFFVCDGFTWSGCP